MKITNGFTMIELLIAVAIVGILALVAYPSYQKSILRGHRSDGIAAALQVQVAQEKFRGNCKFYAGAIDASDVCAGTAADSKVAAPTTSNNGYYTLSIGATVSGNAYKIYITPTGNQTEDTDCSPMTLTFNNSNPNGLKEPADCW